MLLLDCYTSFVNLDHRQDRLAAMTRSLEKAEIQAERTRGMYPSEYKGPEWKVKVMRDRTPGAIGCHYSQVSIMEKAYLKGKHAFVMEDDLVFCEDFQHRLWIIEKFTNSNPWDIIWLGGTFHIGDGPNGVHWHKDTLGRDAECTYDPNIMKTYGCFCTYAYIVNRNSIRKILLMMDELVHKSMGIDWLMIQLQPKLNTFSFVPGCVTQYDNISDIGGRGKAMTVFSGFKKLGPYWYQNRMTDFDPSTFDWKEAKINENSKQT